MNSIPAIKRRLKVYSKILDFVIFNSRRELEPFPALGWSVSTDRMQHAAIQCGCPWTVAFKLDTVYSDSPSSLSSFCTYGVLGCCCCFFRLQFGLSLSSALDVSRNKLSELDLVPSAPKKAVMMAVTSHRDRCVQAEQHRHR